MLLQPNRWSCTITALSILIDEPLETLINEIGHDGSEIIDSSLGEPYCRRGHIMDEMIDLCLKRNYALIPITAFPVTGNDKPCYKDNIARVLGYMDGQKGILVGLNYKDSLHAVVWTGLKIIDPNGYPSTLDNFRIETFWLIKSTF